MPRRILTTAAILTLILGLIALLPSLPLVRDALLKQATTRLAAAGVSLDYRASAGNPWRNVALNGVRLSGLGVDVEVDHIELRYFLPALLGGELPLNVVIDGARGDVDLGEVQDAITTALGSGGGAPSAAAFAPRVALREVSLSRVAVRARNVPFTLPDATLSDLEVREDAGNLRLSGRLSTPHGELVARGVLELPSFDFNGVVSHADVSLAQQWWPGARSGSVSGPLRIERGVVIAEFTIRDGAIDDPDLDLAADHIAGTATMRYPVISADVTAVGFGGPIHASGSVNLKALNYDVTATAEPSLAQAGAWLLRGSLPAGLPVAVTGTAATVLRVSGWLQPVVTGTATGDGTVAGVPLTDLDAHFRVGGSDSIRVDASGELAGGPLRLTVAPSASGDRLELTGRDLDLTDLEVDGFAPGGVIDSFDLALALGGRSSGDLRAAWRGEAFGYAAQLEVDGTIDPDGLHLFATGSGEPPTTEPSSSEAQTVNLRAAAVLAGEHIDGGVHLAGLELAPLERPAELELTGSGTLSDLSLRLELLGDDPVHLSSDLLGTDLAGVSSDADLRGAVTARLRGTELSDIEGALGPLNLTGTAGLEPLRASLDLGLAPVTLQLAGGEQISGATVALPSTHLHLNDGRLTLVGRAEFTAPQLGPVTVDLSHLDLEFLAQVLSPGDNGLADATAGWRLNASDPEQRLNLEVGSSRPLDLVFTDLPLRFSDGPITPITGSVTPAADGELALTARLQPGTQLAGLTLVNGAQLLGTLQPDANRLQLRGRLGAVPLEVSADWSTGDVVLVGHAAELSFQAALPSGAWALTGSAELATFTSELDLGSALDGQFLADLGYEPTDSGYRGAATLNLTDPLPIKATMTGAGSSLDIAVEGELAGVPMKGTGEITGAITELLSSERTSSELTGSEPSLALQLGPIAGLTGGDGEASSQPFIMNLTVDLTGAHGAGLLPAQNLGPLATAPLPWSLAAVWASGTGQLDLGGSVLTAALSGGALKLAGQLDLPVSYAGADYLLTARPGSSSSAGPVTMGQLELLAISGELTAVPPVAAAQLLTAAPLATFTGTPSDLRLELRGSMAQLAAALPEAVRPNGELSLETQLDLTAGPSYHGNVRFAAEASAAPSGRDGGSSEATAATRPSEPITAHFAGSGAELQLSVDGTGLTVDHSLVHSLNGNGLDNEEAPRASRLRLLAQQVDLERFLPSGWGGEIDGTLTLEAGAWRGALTAEISDGLSSDPDPTLSASDSAAVPTVSARALVSGDGPRLLVQLDASAPADSHLFATGVLFPDVRLEGAVTALSGAVTGELTWADVLTGTITSTAQQVDGLLALPAQRAELRFEASSGVLTLTFAEAAPSGLPAPEPTSSALTLSAAGFGGNLTVPLSVLGEPAVLETTFAGPLTDPALTANLLGVGTGEPRQLGTATGSLSGGAYAELRLSPEQLLVVLPALAPAAALLQEGVSASGSWQALDGWTATMDAPLTISAERPLRLAAFAGGAAAAYAGQVSLVEGTASSETALASASFEGVAGAANARLDLANVDWSSLGEALGVPLDVTGSGELTLASEPLRAGLSADLSGHVGQTQLRLHGTTPDDLNLSVSGPAGELEGRLAWAAGSEDGSLGGSASLSGNYDGRALAATLVVADDLNSGNLELVAGDATLTAELASADPGGAARIITVDALVPPGSWLAAGASANARLVLSGDQLTVEAFSATVTDLLGPEPEQALHLSASGSVTPHLDLSGQLTSPGLADEIYLTVGDAHPEASGAGQVQAALLSWRELQLSAILAGDLRVASSGSLAADDLTALLAWFQPSGTVTDLITESAPRVNSTDLSWSHSGGFAGELLLDATTPLLLDAPALSVHARAYLAGSDDTGSADESAAPTAAGLRLEVNSAVPDGVANATLRLSPEPWRDRSVSGELTVDLPLSAISGDLDLAQRLASSAAIGGSWDDPIVSGDLHSSGAVEATGTVRVESGEAHLKLSGPHLRAAAQLNAAGWLADGQLDQLGIDAWLPQLPGAQLSLDLTADSSGITIERLLLGTASSRVEGAVSVGLDNEEQRGVRAALQVQMNLADLDLGDTELTGVLRGPLVLSAASLADLASANLTAELDGAKLGIRGIASTLSGNLALGGQLNDPRVHLLLTGEGDASGSLTADTRPLSGELNLRSDLRLGTLVTDLDVNLREGATSASGSVKWGEAVVLITDSGGVSADPHAGVLVSGTGRLSGWRVTVASDLGRASLHGDLATVGSNLSGLVDVSVDAAADSFLTGSITAVEVAGVALNDLTLSAARANSPIVITSPQLSAELLPLELDWSVALRDLAVAHQADGPLLLSGDGAGHGLTGKLTATVNGHDLALALALAQADSTDLSLSGTLYGGTVDLSAKRADAQAQWLGGGALSDVQLSGVVINATAAVQGGSWLPQLVLRTHAEQGGAGQGLAAQGNATVGLGGVTIDQVLQGEPLSEALRVQGRLLPETDLTLSTIAAPNAAALSPSAASAATTSRVRLRSGAPGSINLSGAALAELPRGGGAATTGLRADGNLRLGLGPLAFRLAGSGGSAELDLALTGLPSWRATAELSAANLLDLAQELLAEGLTLSGVDGARGAATLRLSPEPSASLLDFGLEFAGVDLSASGTISLTSADLHGELRLNTDLPVAEQESGYLLPWNLTTTGDAWNLTSVGPHGTLNAVYAPSGDLELQADLNVSGGRLEGKLGLVGETGLAGSLSLVGMRLLSPQLGALEMGLDASVADGKVAGAATLATSAGRASLSGSWGLGGLLPRALAPDAPTGGRLEARLRALELSEVPLVAEWLPHLAGSVSGVAQLRDGLIFGQFVAPELQVADRTSRFELSLSGPLDAIDLSLQVRGAVASATLAGNRLGGVVRLERFPINLLADAVLGGSDVNADLTGVMRFDLPLSDPLTGYLRLATEEVLLERLGVPTVGNVTLTYDDRTLTVENAAFEGLGSWRANGQLRPEKLDFHLEANEADFTPLLGLVPSFARLGVGAEGSFSFAIGGSAANPNAQLSSPNLEVEIAGSRYRLDDTSVNLEGVSLTTSTRISGLSPLTGSLGVSGGAFLSLDPLVLHSTDLAFEGSLDLPGVGIVNDLSGKLYQDPEGAALLDASGRMGEGPVTLRGTLTPLRIEAAGRNISLALPSLLIGDATVDADLTLSAEDDGLALGGSVVASTVIVDLGAQAARPDPVSDEVPRETASDGAANALAALRFDSLAIRAPQRVLLSASIGSFEAGLNLVLTGTAATPRLSGTATALRGNLRFSGRDFIIDRAVASFTPNRGVYPDLDVAAHTEFDKSRVISAAPNVGFAAPPGATFDVTLSFAGPVVGGENGAGGFHFDVKPKLGSNAVIEVSASSPGGSAGNSLSSGLRTFTEAELMSLLTLGRFELNADLVGAGGLGEAVAQGALDTAVDLLVVSELENALREALGLDVVEIRTSSLTSLLEEEPQPFGVSLRLGGYLNPDLFASYRIGTYDGGDPNYSLTNEVLLRYGLGPLDLDLIGRLDFPAAGTIEQARPELGVVLGYAFGPGLSIDTGLTLSTQRSTAEFGVTLRW